MNTPTHFDVIIVGGRVAGSTLAARLGQAGLRVLLLERGRHPTPHPASSPAISSATLSLLDEIGAPEGEYARNTPRLRRFVYTIRAAFEVCEPVPHIHGRNYSYAPDRARFDAALWEHALRQGGVSGIEGAAVRDLLWDGDGRVCGVIARVNGEERTFTADLVVGADGRFSLVARKVGAAEFRRIGRLQTSLLYAYWEGVAPYDGVTRDAVHYISPRHGLGILLLDSADGRTAVTIEGQAALLESDGRSPLDHYLDILRSSPEAWIRLKDAPLPSKVHGMKKVGNFYREAGGRGWALVGDALHQKDPVDGQGIYDAAFTAKALAEAIVAARAGQRWEAAVAGYATAVRRETYPMYLTTLATALEYFFLPLPQWVFATLIRWLFEDADYRRRLLLLLARGHRNPLRWRTLPVVVRAVGRGLWRDFGRWRGRRVSDVGFGAGD